MPASALRTDLAVDQLTVYVERLMANYFPDGVESPHTLVDHVSLALDRIEHCFSSIHRKYYNFNGEITFSHLNSDHMAAFLYLLGNTIWKQTGDTVVPTKLFYLNKVMNGLDLYFSVELPDIFLLVHPVGTVIGNAAYSDYLVVYQNCTIGSDAGIYPRLGPGVILYSRTSVVGNCEIGADVVFAAGSTVINANIAANSTVVGQFPNHRALPNDRSVRSRIFDA